MRRHLMQVLLSFTQGGAETVARDLAIHLDRRQIRSSACALDAGGPIKADFECAGVPTYVMDRRPGFDWRLIGRLHRLFRREHVDIVQTHQLTQLVYAGVAARLAGARLIHVEHEYFTLQSAVAQRRLRLLSRLCQKVVAVSNEVGEFLLGIGLPAGDVVVIRNGVDTCKYKPITHDPSRMSANSVIGHVARMDKLKDQSTLLHAFRLVLESHPNARLVVAGEGPMDAQLRALARRLNVADRVEFLGLRRDIETLLPRFDVFVLSSITEGLPLVILEAMASGLPVVATGVGSIPHVVQDGVTGFVVKPGDIEALAKRLITVIEQPELAHNMGRAGRGVAAEHFSFAHTVRLYEALYDCVG